ncbi:MAG: hypothetical protein MZV64_10205 [Ignavibacteriales bacterium]|nr:hypothetical protein [Ignavibacteriales bacterium]
MLRTRRAFPGAGARNVPRRRSAAQSRTHRPVAATGRHSSVLAQGTGS